MNEREAIDIIKLQTAWAEQKILKKVYDDKERTILREREKKCDENREKIKEKEKEIIKSLPKKTQKLIKKRKRLKKIRYFWVIFFPVLAFLIMFDVLGFGFSEHVPKTLYYIFSLPVSIFVSLMISRILRKKANGKIIEINNSEEIKKYEKLIKSEKSKISRRTSRDKRQDDELKKIEEFRKEYRKLQKQVISLTYVDCALFYFKKFSTHGFYRIYVDGVCAAYSQSENFTVVKLNKGYHTITIECGSKFTRSDGTLSYHDDQERYQVNTTNSPIFFEINKADSIFKSEEVTVDKFLNIAECEIV